MYHTNVNLQIRMMRQNNQNGGPNGHSNVELVSNVTPTSHAHPPRHATPSSQFHEIPLATNSTHLNVPSTQNHSSIIQIKDSEII